MYKKYTRAFPGRVRTFLEYYWSIALYNLLRLQLDVQQYDLSLGVKYYSRRTNVIYMRRVVHTFWTYLSLFISIVAWLYHRTRSNTPTRSINCVLPRAKVCSDSIPVVLFLVRFYVTREARRIRAEKYVIIDGLPRTSEIIFRVRDENIKHVVRYPKISFVFLFTRLSKIHVRREPVYKWGAVLRSLSSIMFCVRILAYVVFEKFHLKSASLPEVVETDRRRKNLVKIARWFKPFLHLVFVIRLLPTYYWKCFFPASFASFWLHECTGKFNNYV